MSYLKSFINVVLPILILVISSCNDNESVAPDYSSSPKKLVKIYESSGNYSAFSYNNERLTKYEKFVDSVGIISRTFNYEGKDKPVSENYISENTDILNLYFYNSSILLDSTAIMFRTSSGNYILSGYIKHLYNESGQLVYETHYTNGNNLIIKTEYIYDSNGNVSERWDYDSDGLGSISSMTYDDKINPLHSLHDCLNLESSINNNNLLSRAMTDVRSGMITETMFSYEYDDDDYPVSVSIEVDGLGGAIIIGQTYEYD